MKPSIYEGRDPYIFVSYAHKDSEAVYRILNELDQNGCRLWYDDGIAPGSEWPEDIATHLGNAALVLAFITPNTVASANCRREINYALSKDIPLLSIFLEKTEMPPGLEMQLSAQQSILRYNYRSYESFIRKILNTSVLKLCCAAATEEPVPEATAPVYTEEVKREIQNAPKKVKKGPKKKSGDRKTLRSAAVGAAVIFLFAVLLLFVDSRLHPKASWGEKINRSETVLRLSEKTFQQEDLRIISSMKNAEVIALTNCDFSNCDFSTVSFSDSVKEIDLGNSTGINHLGFLNTLKLEKLNLDGCEKLTDLSGLNLTSLITLSINDTPVSDISPLSNAESLVELYAADTEISDLSALSTASELQRLDISGTKVSSISPISLLEKLDKLNISNCSLGVITEPLMSLRLAEFHAASCGLENLDILNNCTVLNVVDVSGNPSLTSLSSLITQNASTLQSLNLSCTSVSDTDIKSLNNCKSLVYLNLRGLELHNLDFCKDLADLKTIVAENCQLTDISGLRGCTRLNGVHLAFNGITDISVLSSIVPDLFNTIVDLSFNNITDVSSLSVGGYAILMLQGNDGSLIKTYKNEVEAQKLVVSYSEEMLNTDLSDAYILSNIYIIDCPANKILAAEEAASAFNNVNIMSMDELMEGIINHQISDLYDIDYTYVYEVYKAQK